MRWKYRLYNAAPEAVLNVLRALPEWCIKQTVEAYQKRSPARKLAKPEALILSRDSFVSQRFMGAKHFLAYFKSEENGVLPKDWELVKKGQAPKFWFADYVRQHPSLQRYCNASHSRYVSLLKMYQRAVKLYVENGSAVVEDDSATEAEEVEERPGGRFKYKIQGKANSISIHSTASLGIASAADIQGGQA